MSKKLKNLNIISFVFVICLLLPLCFLIFGTMFKAISLSGVTSANEIDFFTLFASECQKFNDINLLGSTAFNKWVFDYLFIASSNSNAVIIVNFVVWYFEYFICIYILKIVVNLLVLLPMIVDKYFYGGK